MNGAVVEFYGFAGPFTTLSGTNTISTPPFMLVKILHDVGFNIQIPGLPPNVVPIETITFTHGNIKGGRGVKLQQFPVTLAYAMTDFKCQGRTFHGVIVDIKKPTGRGAHSSPATSAYVQLSRSKTRSQVSIIRPFNEKDLREKLPQELQDELDWQEAMAERTTRIYG